MVGGNGNEPEQEPRPEPSPNRPPPSEPFTKDDQPSKQREKR